MLLGTSLLHHSPHCLLVEAWLATCSINAPPPPTPSREPWEAESHHHGDLNTDPPHTGPLWLACVEVRGNKMSQQQVFLCFCFCLNSRWDCAQIHALSYTAGTAVETAWVRETSWFEKWIEWHGNRLNTNKSVLLLSFLFCGGVEHQDKNTTVTKVCHF